MTTTTPPHGSTDTDMSPDEAYRGVLDFAHRADPYPFLAQLRRTPVARLEDGTVLVTGYDEILQLVHDPRVSSDPTAAARCPVDHAGARTDTGPSGDIAPTPPPEEGDAGDDAAPSLLSAFVLRDPPQHDRLRRQTMRHFGPPHKPEYVDGLRADMTRIVDELIDRFPAHGEVDIVDAFAYPFPVTMICEVLGVPREDEPKFHAWSEAIIAPPEAEDDAEAAELREQSDRANEQLAHYLGELIEDKSSSPKDDLLSGLVSDEGTTDAMSRVDMVNTAIMLLIGGHETTVNMIASGVRTLLHHPEIVDRLEDEPTLMSRVFEELLRLEPPAQVTPTRVPLVDITLGGTTIAAGTPVYVVWAAANRDGRHFPDPDRFDPDRARNDHLGFGSGIHSCFGAPLARLEVQIALAALFRRLENPRLVLDPPPFRRNPFLRGPRHLHVAYDRIRP